MRETVNTMDSEDLDDIIIDNTQPILDAYRGLTRGHAFNLYLSHALSTWNARGYEFAAILFTAAAYPETLTAAALRMIILYFAMIIFSSSIGDWVQRSPSRLRTLLATICYNRGSVIIGSFFWMFILSQEHLLTGQEPAAASSWFVLPRNDALKGFLFAVAVGFGIVERLSASANLISMERDWIVTVAGPIGHPYDLTNLNAMMGRIDLTCKLISPVLISIIISATGSIRVGVLYTGLTSLVSIPIEILSATHVWNSSVALQAPKPCHASVAAEGSRPETQGAVTGMVALLGRLRQYFKGFDMYFSSSVWMPSFALAMLHFNMLTWRATFITYLINIGYSLNVITIARGFGSLFEISSTAITPRGIVYLGKTGHQSATSGDGPEVGLLDQEYPSDQPADHTQTLIGLQRLGLWGISSQLINTLPIVLAVWAISTQRPEANNNNDAIPHTPIFPRLIADTSPTPTTPVSTAPPHLSILWSVVLFAFLALSRLGVWVYTLTTQQLTQTLVPEGRRSSFAGVEAAVVNAFEVLGVAAAIALPRVDQYPWLALASLLLVSGSWALYAAWVRSRRGHLVHWEKIALRRAGW